MQEHAKAHTIKNHYEPRSTFRTFTGVASSLLMMGIPVGLTEFLRPGGDRTTWMISFVAVILALALAVLSVKGTLEE